MKIKFLSLLFVFFAGVAVADSLPDDNTVSNGVYSGSSEYGDNPSGMPVDVDFGGIPVSVPTSSSVHPVAYISTGFLMGLVCWFFAVGVGGVWRGLKVGAGLGD